MDCSKNATEAIFGTVIKHTEIDRVLKSLMEHLDAPTSTKLLLVTGPTGSGKTTARLEFGRQIASAFKAQLQADTAQLAFAEYTVKAPGPTAFSWKDCYIQLLKSLSHPFAENSPALVRANANGPEFGTISIGPGQAHGISNDRLFRIVQSTILKRKPKAILVDEAQHLLRVASHQSLLNQLEHLKYLADETQTLHVLFGTYELVRLADLSGALIRRREIIHLPRYI